MDSTLTINTHNLEVRPELPLPMDSYFHSPFVTDFHIRMRPFTDDEYNSLPHVIMTSDQIWDPRIFDDSDTPYDITSLPTFPHQHPHKNYDLRGVAKRASVLVIEYSSVESV